MAIILFYIQTAVKCMNAITHDLHVTSVPANEQLLPDGGANLEDP